MDVTYERAAPLCFSVHYASLTSKAAMTGPLSLCFVCRKVQHAQNWVMALRLLQRAFSQTWGLPTEQIRVVKAAFRAAKGSGERLTLGQQQDFFACLNYQVTASNGRTNPQMSPQRAHNEPR